MSLDKFKQHEILFLLLYSIDIGKNLPEDSLIELISDECKVAKSYVKEEMQKLDNLLPFLERIDTTISTALTEYSLQRVFSTDRNILRLAVYELMFEKRLDHNIIFSEAARLAKKFSTPDSASFVQSVLGSIQKSHNILPSPPPQLV
jgi:transcription antitermination protein NusB